MQNEQDHKNSSDGHDQKLNVAPVYSIFGANEKFFMMIILSIIGLWSTVSSPIYFPALTVLSNYFHTSESMMNISVVVYLISQGVAPTISSNLADTIGRRPIMLMCLLIYVGACIGLALTRTFWLLVLLRCIQGAGIAPVIAINSGIGGDITTRAERGGFVGIVGGLQLTGQAFGSLIGSGFMSSFDWRSIFWFLAIGGGTTFVIAFILLPETQRSIVGNGSIKPKKLINISPILYFPPLKQKITNDMGTLQENAKFNFFAAYKILFDKIVIVCLFASGFQYAAWTMVLTTMSTELASKYNYSVLHIGLVYLPQGICCLISSVITGKFLNWFYLRKKSQYDSKYAQMNVQVRPVFNIYRTRLTVLFPSALMMSVGLIIFGWCVEYKQHIISVIISSCLISFAASSFISAGSTMLVDIYPSQGSTSTSCMNLVRCLLAAAGTGALSSITQAINVGGCYTLMSGFCLASYSIMIFVVFKR